jgi:hypothetical protein
MILSLSYLANSINNIFCAIHTALFVYPRYMTKPFEKFKWRRKFQRYSKQSAQKSTKIVNFIPILILVLTSVYIKDERKVDSIPLHAASLYVFKFCFCVIQAQAAGIAQSV